MGATRKVHGVFSSVAVVKKGGCVWWCLESGPFAVRPVAPQANTLTPCRHTSVRYALKFTGDGLGFISVCQSAHWCSPKHEKDGA